MSTFNLHLRLRVFNAEKDQWNEKRGFDLSKKKKKKREVLSSMQMLRTYIYMCVCVIRKQGAKTKQKYKKFGNLVVLRRKAKLIVFLVNFLVTLLVLYIFLTLVYVIRTHFGC